jgi:DNA-directed RNA polymerase subunit RPC12/RpoP
MAQVSFPCTNPNCGRQLFFDTQQVGSVQQCPHCAQRIIVPDAVANLPALPVQPSTVIAPNPQVERPAQYAFQQERAIEAQTSRRLKMGAGCFAMIAVMFAVALFGFGVGTVAEVDPKKLWGWSSMIAGLAGLAAFVYFGYIATETASSSSDRGRM